MEPHGAAASFAPCPVSVALRHSHASMLLDQGEALGTVADRLGHKTTRVTEQVYKHRLTEVIEGGTATAELLG